jgi:hypothetical protein
MCSYASNNITTGTSIIRSAELFDACSESSGKPNGHQEIPILSHSISFELVNGNFRRNLSFDSPEQPAASIQRRQNVEAAILCQDEVGFFWRKFPYFSTFLHRPGLKPALTRIHVHYS